MATHTENPYANYGIDDWNWEFLKRNERYKRHTKPLNVGLKSAPASPSPITTGINRSRLEDSPNKYFADVHCGVALKWADRCVFS